MTTMQILAVDVMARQWCYFWFRGYVLPPAAEA